jgi:hypothetical protein
MGYHTRVWPPDSIEIDPPIEWGEMKDSEFVNGDSEVSLAVREEDTETDQGILTRRYATRLEVTYQDEYREIDLTGAVQDAIDAFPDHTFTGRFNCFGEDNEDIWRVVIRDGKAIKVQAHIVWPDEEESA